MPRRSTSRRLLITGLAALGMSLSLAAATRAQFVPTPVFGSTAQGVGGGMRVMVDTTWVNGTGYRPVRIKVVPLAPPPADRTLTVEFSIPSQWGEGGKLVVGRDIEIPAGSGPVEVEMPAPIHFMMSQCQFTVWEDGKAVKGLDFTLSPSSTTYYGWEESLPNILFVGDAAPDTTVLTTLMPAAQYANQYTGQTGALNLPSLVAQPADRLPQNWLDYTSVDIVCLSLDELHGLAAERPAALEAIRRWTAAGGNLWVYGIGDAWENLPLLEQRLGLPPADPAATDPAGRGWTLPDLKHRGHLQAAYGSNGMGYYQDQIYYQGQMAIDPNTGLPVDALPPVNGVQPDPPNPDETAPKAPFVSRSLSQGQVVAIAPANPFPGTYEDWGWLLNHVGDDRYLWFMRHGLSLRRANEDFWNWLIPGVRLAPVTAFRVLITLFVLAIGPVNYWWLWRKKRLHLLLVVVPLSALVITGSLFAYAVLADGLGVRARVRSFTQIDQRQGEAICLSRISYYAGLAPYGGLTFPDDVAVLPLPAGGTESSEHPVAIPRAVDWTSEGQRLVSGWLDARTPTQYVTLRSRRTEYELLVTERPGQPPQVENRLATPIHRLLLVASDGTLYQGLDIGSEATVDLAPADAAGELLAIRQAILAQAPRVPDGVQPGQDYGWFSSYRYSPYYGSDVPAAYQGTGRMERALMAVASLKVEELRPRSYVAIVQRSPEVELGVSANEERDALHVVVGDW